MAPVRHRPDVEQVQPGEEEALRELSILSRDVQENVPGEEGGARHATHARATALPNGTLVVEGGLPPELAQGPFAPPRGYDAPVRFSQGPSEDISDKASGRRGLSIKALGVEGPHVAGGREATAQDRVPWVRDAAFTDAAAQASCAPSGPPGPSRPSRPPAPSEQPSARGRGGAGDGGPGGGAPALPRQTAGRAGPLGRPHRPGCPPPRRWRRSATPASRPAMTTRIDTPWRASWPGMTWRSTFAPSSAPTSTPCRSRTPRWLGPRS